MSPFSSIILILFIIIGIVLYLLGFQSLAIITGLVGLIVKILDIIPKSDVRIKIERVSQTAHKIIIQNLGSLKISDIHYNFHGRMMIDDLPKNLDSYEIYESLIGLSFETGRLLDVRVSWRPQFGLLRKRRHIKQEVIG